jgi:hypothetical protein
MRERREGKTISNDKVQIKERMYGREARSKA